MALAAREGLAAHLEEVAAEASGHRVAQAGAAVGLLEDTLAALAAGAFEVTVAGARGTAEAETWATEELAVERVAAERGRLSRR